MQNTLSILTALSEPTRLKALLILWDGEEHCTCELMKLLGKSQSCTSRHMAALKKAGLVVSRQDAQFIWVATQGQGLFLIDTDKRRLLQHYTQKNGTISNFIKAIAVESDSIYWLATNKGLQRIKYPFSIVVLQFL